MPRSGRVTRINLQHIPAVAAYVQRGYRYASDGSHIAGYLEEANGPDVVTSEIELSDEEKRGRTNAHYNSLRGLRYYIFDSSIPLSYRFFLLPQSIDLYLAYELDEVIAPRWSRKPRIKKRKTTRKPKPPPQPTPLLIEKHKHILTDGNKYLRFPVAKSLDNLSVNDRIVWNPMTYEVWYAGNVVYASFYKDYYERFSLAPTERLQVSTKGEFAAEWFALLNADAFVLTRDNEERTILMAGEEKTIMDTIRTGQLIIDDDSTVRIERLTSRVPFKRNEYKRRLP